MTTTETAKLLHTIERHRFQDELRHLKTRQGRFDAAMLHLDHPLPGSSRPFEASDGGCGAAVVRNACEATPLWLTLWRRERAALKPKARIILDALSQDWRTVSAARIAGVSKNTVKAWKKIFKSHFTQAYRAWKRDFAS